MDHKKPSWTFEQSETVYLEITQLSLDITKDGLTFEDIQKRVTVLAGTINEYNGVACTETLSTLVYSLLEIIANTQDDTKLRPRLERVMEELKMLPKDRVLTSKSLATFTHGYLRNLIRPPNPALCGVSFYTFSGNI